MCTSPESFSQTLHLIIQSRAMNFFTGGTTMKTLYLFVALVAASMGMTACDSDTVTSSAQLSDGDRENLIFMREEEKLARDVYIVLGEKWGLGPFLNIQESEARHMDMVKGLLDTYGIDDPIAETDDQVGVFVNQDLQGLYDQLVEQGLQSAVEALKVGALIEETDIRDLGDAILQTSRNDIRNVLGQLQDASGNHLRAFVSNLEQRGVDYQPQILSGEEYNAIMTGG